MTPEYRIKTEKQIKRYLHSQGITKVIYVQVEQTFDDLDGDVNVWNVKTNKGNWWVVEGDNYPMNLYPQDAFYFSADEAYSFHVGISERLRSDYQKNFKHIIDEIPLDIEKIKSIKRKLVQAAQQLNLAIESEQFQAIGLICRECLVDLARELAKRNKKIIAEKNLKEADFKGIANVIIDLYIPGENNSDLRSYSRKIVDLAWSYSSNIVHSPNKNYPDIKINILFVSAAVTLFENLFLKYIGFDHEFKCSKCRSNDYELIESDKEKELIFRCNHCEHQETIKIKKSSS